MIVRIITRKMEMEVNMLRYVIERILLIIATMFVVITLNFFLLQLTEGSPFDNGKITQVQIEMMKNKFGLNEPPMKQYMKYLQGLVKGDLGTSFRLQNKDVSELIAEKLPHTIKIGSLALVFGIVVGILLGALAAIYRNSFWDHFVTVLAVIGVSIPSFVMAAFLQYYLVVKLELFPFLYLPINPEKGISALKSLHSMILPALSLSLFVISATMRYMRSELVEVLNSDYILLARAKGLNKSQVIMRHALRNALIPIITIVGPMAIGLLTGSLVVEMFFGVPGLSRLLLNAVTQNDYFLVLGVNSFYSLLYVVIVLVVDLLYGVIDPRIRLKGGN